MYVREVCDAPSERHLCCLLISGNAVDCRGDTDLSQGKDNGGDSVFDVLPSDGARCAESQREGGY